MIEIKNISFDDNGKVRQIVGVCRQRPKLEYEVPANTPISECFKIAERMANEKS